MAYTMRIAERTARRCPVARSDDCAALPTGEAAHRCSATRFLGPARGRVCLTPNAGGHIGRQAGFAHCSRPLHGRGISVVMHSHPARCRTAAKRGSLGTPLSGCSADSSGQALRDGNACPAATPAITSSSAAMIARRVRCMCPPAQRRTPRNGGDTPAPSLPCLFTAAMFRQPPRRPIAPHAPLRTAPC